MPHKSYERRSPKHDPTDSYFHLTINIAKCTMRADSPNLGNYSVGTEITGTKMIPVLQVCSIDNSKSKEFCVDKNLSQVCSMDK